MVHGVAVGEDVPVDDNVHILLYGRVYGGDSLFLYLLRLAEIAVFAGVHGYPKEVRAIF